MSDQNREVYNRAVLVFGSSGDLYASEDALRLVRRSDPIAAVATDGGVVFGTAQETATSLVQDGDKNTLYKLDEHLGAVVAGNGIDARRVVDKMQQLAQGERLEYGTAIRPEELARQTETAVEEAINFDTERPHGMVSLFGGVEGGRPAVYEVLPHGETTRHRAVAAGQNRGVMMEALEDGYEGDLSLSQARELVVDALGRVHNLGADEVRVSLAEVPTETETYRHVDSDAVADLITD